MKKLNEFFPSVFTVEDVGQIPVAELTFSEREFEELCQTVMTRDAILGLIDKVKTDKFLVSGDIHFRSS